MSLIIPANSAAASGGYAVDNSCRFNDGDSPRMHKTPSGAGNRRKFTISAWVKRGSNLGANSYIFDARVDGSDNAPFQFNTSDQIFFRTKVGGSSYYIQTNRVFRDVSAFYHLAIVYDNTLGTAGDRIQLWVNGVRETSFAGSAMPPQNTDTTVNNASVVQTVGSEGGGASFFDGYISEFVLLDGTANSPVDTLGSFDEDSGIWKPINVSGLTFGTNGFYLDFEDSANLGNDANGGTDLTEVNLAATDQSTDTCTNNFITLNPLIGTTSFTDNQVYSEGNTIVIPNSTDNYGTAFGTFGATKGKWYWEAQIVWNGTSTNANFPKQIGFMREDYAFNKSYLGQNDDQTWGVAFHDLGTDGWGLDHNGSFSAISGATTMANGGTVMLALDLDNGKFYMGYNGTFFTSGDPTSGATGTGAIATLDATDLSFTIIPAVTNATNSTYYKFNFGNPAYAISSGNADGNGYGNFEYAVPANYYCLNTKNLSEYG